MGVLRHNVVPAIAKIGCGNPAERVDRHCVIFVQLPAIRIRQYCTQPHNTYGMGTLIFITYILEVFKELTNGKKVK